MTRSSFVATLSLLLVLSACGPSKPASVNVGGVEMTAEQTLLANAAKADMLRTFVGTVRQAKLDATLEGAGPFTIFAPNDQAFLALPPESPCRGDSLA
jgi:uncharacterized surface protein with fasciclin (FAS1) repeats